MKLLVFCSYYPPHIGGSESHADEFNKYLSREGIGIVVFTPRLPLEALENEIRHNNVKIIRFPAFEIIPNYPLPKFWSVKFWKLFFSLFRQDFNIIISRTRFFSTSLLALIYAKIKRTKWIHVEHGSDFVQLSSKFKTGIAKIYDYTFGRLILKLSDRNISISKAVKKFITKFDKRESPVIYRGLDLERIDKVEPDHELKEKYKDKTIISFVGRLYKWKGVENSIKAIKNLPPEIKNNVVFIIAGDGEDIYSLKMLASKDKNIVFLGHTTTEKAISLLKISSIYLHSAYSGGGLSTSLLEAMYCGCVVIATPNEGADEVIEDNTNGLLIERSDAKIISEKIKQLINNSSDIKKLGNAAKIKIENNFTWKKSILQYLRILRSI
jgi:glycosyltransferase involved in cell wall biosynthesis